MNWYWQSKKRGFPLFFLYVEASENDIRIQNQNGKDKLSPLPFFF